MKRGDIRWYTFKKPDKKRPVLILTRTSILEYMGEITVAPITSVVREIPSEVYLDKYDGMPKACVVNFDHIQTVSKGKIGALITVLPEQKMFAVTKAISFALDLPVSH